MTRITTGTAKNKKIIVPDVPEIRAVQDVAKLAIFSIITDKKTNGAACLDLFAGSGSLGLEALSRGADWCDFVDENVRAVQAIEKNLINCGFEGKAETFKKDSIKFVVNAEKKYDLVFADPFYENTKHKFLLKNLEEILNDDGIIIFLHGEQLDLESQIENIDLKITTTRRFGKSFFSVLKRASETKN